MIYKISVAPAVEPVSLSQLKQHLYLDSGSMADNTTMYASIASGSHAVVTAYTLLGTAVDVIGHNAVVYLQPVNNGTGGTVDVKIQEADTSTGPWTDWTGGAFTQVTEATDTIIQEKQYTGSKQWIRTVAKTLVAACEFGTSVAVWEPTSTEDEMLSEMITMARLDVENDTSRKIVTQTIDYYPQTWPLNDGKLKLPFGNLQTVTSVKWKDEDGTETELTAGTDYLVELNGNQCGYLVLPDDGEWPTDELYPSNPITIEYVCGYGLAADVPATIKQAIKRRVTNYHMNRGDDYVGKNQVHEDVTYKRLINNVPRLYDLDFL